MGRLPPTTVAAASASNRTHTFPESVRRFDRGDGQLELVAEGTLPADLQGFVFIIGPTGAHGRPASSDTPFLNGDGTLYRIAFDGERAVLDWRLMRPACFWAEELARTNPAFADARFYDRGIARVSSNGQIGGRNMLNTALQAIRFGDGPERLLVTYESGRPYEVCPETLRLVTPMGRRERWLPTLFPDSPFALISATSHPAFHPQREEVYAMNFVRGWRIYAKRLLRALQSGWRPGMLLRRAQKDGGAGRRRSRAPGGSPLGAIAGFRQRRGGLLPKPASRLVLWDGAKEPTTVEVVDGSGKPLELMESAHQMLTTERYVLVTDAAFKFEMDLVFRDLDGRLPSWLIRLIRRRLSRPQPSTTRLHLIPLAEIDAVRSGRATKARAQTVTLPASIVHCFADYDDAGGTRVVVHVVDNAGSDSSEFLEQNDRSELRGGPLSPEVLGMMPAGTDVDRFRRFTIHLEDGAVLEVEASAEITDHDAMWTVALASGPGVAMSEPLPAIRDLYFYTHGLMPPAMSELVWDLYREAPRRVLSADDVRRRALAGGHRARLARYTSGARAIDTGWEAPTGCLLLSPQWAPSSTAGHPGYVVGALFEPEGKAIAIFHAGELSEGPVCVLRPREGSLPWGYVVHSTYLAKAERAPGSYRITPREDLEPWLDVPLVKAVVEAMEGSG
jgi:hypothetical protein